MRHRFKLVSRLQQVAVGCLSLDDVRIDEVANRCRHPLMELFLQIVYQPRFRAGRGLLHPRGWPGAARQGNGKGQQQDGRPGERSLPVEYMLS